VYDDKEEQAALVLYRLSGCIIDNFQRVHPKLQPSYQGAMVGISFEHQTVD
jgi:hypothetical protein